MAFSSSHLRQSIRYNVLNSAGYMFIALGTVFCIFAEPSVARESQNRFVIEETIVSQEILPNADSICRWDELRSDERAQIWHHMSVKHRDFHWRQLSKEEKREIKQHLTPSERRRIRERFVYRSNNPVDRPYVLYKRLSKEELHILRLQIHLAKQNQFAKDRNIKTPALQEYEEQLAHRDSHPPTIIVFMPESSQEESNASSRTILVESRLPVHKNQSVLYPQSAGIQKSILHP